MLSRKGLRRVFLRDGTLRRLWKLQRERGVVKGKNVEYPPLSDIIDSLLDKENGL